MLAAARFPADRLLGALAAVPPGKWSQPATAEDLHPGYRTVALVVDGRWSAAAGPFRFVLDVFTPVWSAWISRVEPGGRIGPHRDAGPFRERWQVPIVAAGALNGRPAVVGVPFRVEQWETHSVTNPTDRPRIHLVIDRDVVLDPSPAPFRRMD